METDRHLHVCACGERWTCSKVDCHIADECSQCEAQTFADWAEANRRQPTLEPVEALLSGGRDESE